jgi:hypothetical protein
MVTISRREAAGLCQLFRLARRAPMAPGRPRPAAGLARSDCSSSCRRRRWCWRRRRPGASPLATKRSLRGNGRISRRRRPSNPFASRGAAWPSTSVSFFAHPLAEGDTPMYGRLGRINPSCDKVRGAAFFAKIRASATGESDLPCIYGTKWPASGTRDQTYQDDCGDPVESPRRLQINDSAPASQLT